MLEVGAVVNPWREDHHVGFRAPGCEPLEHAQQLGGVVIDGGHPLPLEQITKQLFHDPPVLQEVGHAGGATQVVFQHPPGAFTVTDQIQPRDVAPALLGRFEPLHLWPPTEARFDRLQRDHSIGQDLPLAVDVGEEAIDRFEPLLEALIEALPVLLINQPRQWIKRQDPFTGLAVVVVEAKGGA